MCRLAAYIGPSIPLSDLVVDPAHSLLVQSQQASEAKIATNGDGFGIAWYSGDPEPGLYRDVSPAWSDGNLMSLCRHVRSPLFLAHVRAATTGETVRTNCHPFTFGRWSFMHNGQFGSFGRMRRSLESRLTDELYDARRGTTDSEVFFLLMILHGLDNDPEGAVRRSLLAVRDAYESAGTVPAIRLSCTFSDGERLYAFRHASDRREPSLYRRCRRAGQGTIIASEPLDGSPENWESIAPDVLFVTGGEAVRPVSLAG